MQAGPPEHPVLALTEEGISELTWTSSASGGDLALSPLLAEPSALAGSRSFLSDFPFLVDVDADGALDAVIPGWDGLAIHRGLPGGGFSTEATFRGRLPDDSRFGGNGVAVRSIPSPSFFDVDGDKVPDLVIVELRGAPQRVAIAKGLGGARFEAPRWISFSCLARPTTEPPVRARERDNGPDIEPLRVAWFGDLDGDGRADIVTREGIDTGKSDMKQAKKPQMRYRVFGLRPDGTVDPSAKTTFDAEGYAFSGA